MKITRPNIDRTAAKMSSTERIRAFLGGLGARARYIPKADR